MRRFQCYMAGEKEPFINGSNPSLARVMRALVETGSRLHSSLYIGDKLDRGCSLMLAVEVPEGQEERFKETAKCSLVRHPDIQVGMETQKSVKYYDEE